MFTPTVTISLEQYEMQKRMLKDMEQQILTLREELDEARALAHTSLISAFEAQYFSYDDSESPTVYLRCVPWVVNAVNEVLAANPNPTGTIFKVDESEFITSSGSESLAMMKYIGLKFKQKYKEVEVTTDGE